MQVTGLPKQLLRRVRSLSTRQQAALLSLLIAAVGLIGFFAYRSITRATVISTASDAGEIAEVIDSAPSIAEVLPSPSPAATMPTVAPPVPSPTPIFGLVKSIDKTGAYVVNRDGSVLRRIIDDASGTGFLSCAPDGARFSYQSSNDGYAADLSGNFKKISSDSPIGRASWSADSKYVAHTRSINGSERDIAITNAASGQRRDIHTPGDDRGVGWSSRGRLATNSTEGIFILKDDGSEMKMVHDPPSNVEEIKWSPDGGTLVATGSRPHVLIEEDGSNIRSLRSDEGDFNVWSPDWSPTSSEIVFQAVNRTTREIFLEISPRQGGTSRAFARDLYYPAWSPDGKTIAALETDHDPAFQRLVTISPTGQGKRTVVSAPAKATISADQPCWLGPDQILFSAGVSS